MHQSMAFAIATFTALVVGQFLHAWLLASNCVNSSLNGIVSYRQYLRINAAILTFRFALAWAIFALYSHEGAAVCAAISSSVPGMSWLAAHPIPVNPATGMIYGLFADPIINSLFGFLSRWVPALKNEIPPTAQSGAEKKAA